MADCTYRVPDLNASGDALYGPRICNQPFIDWLGTYMASMVVTGRMAGASTMSATSASRWPDASTQCGC